MTIDEAISVATRFSDKEIGRGAEPLEISAAESKLGVAFPTSYRMFLTRIGWGRFASERLFGLGADVPPYLDLVRVTWSERTQAFPTMPNRLIPIMNDGAGNHFCLESSLISNGENPVVFWDHELGREQKTRQIAPNFAEWFSGLLFKLS